MNIENTIKSGLYILLLLMALPAGAFAQTAEQAPDMVPIAEGKEKWLGNIYSSPQIENFTSYWNQVTAENAGKWGSVERNPWQLQLGSA